LCRNEPEGAPFAARRVYSPAGIIPGAEGYESAEDIGNLERIRPVFGEDGLHLTDDGYAQFERYFRKAFFESYP